MKQRMQWMKLNRGLDDGCRWRIARYCPWCDIPWQACIRHRRLRLLRGHRRDQRTGRNQSDGTLPPVPQALGQWLQVMWMHTVRVVRCALGGNGQTSIWAF